MICFSQIWNTLIKQENPLIVVLYKQCCSLVLDLLSVQETPVRFLWREDPWRRDRLPTPAYLGLPGGWDGKESICNAGDLGSIPRLGWSPGGGHSNPLQYSSLENPVDRGDLWAPVHGVTKNQTQLNKSSNDEPDDRCMQISDYTPERSKDRVRD